MFRRSGALHLVLAGLDNGGINTCKYYDRATRTPAAAAQDVSSLHAERLTSFCLPAAAGQQW